MMMERSSPKVCCTILPTSTHTTHKREALRNQLSTFAARATQHSGDEWLGLSQSQQQSHGKIAMNKCGWRLRLVQQMVSVDGIKAQPAKHTQSQHVSSCDPFMIVVV